LNIGADSFYLAGDIKRIGADSFYGSPPFTDIGAAPKRIGRDVPSVGGDSKRSGE